MARYVAPTASDVTSEAILGFDDEQLAALVAARPDLLDAQLSSLAQLANRAGTWNSLVTCFLGLDLAGQQVFEALLLLPTSTSVESLVRLLGPDVGAAEVEPVLARLAGLALVGRDGGLRVVEPARQVSYPAGLGPSLTQLTGGLKVEDLTKICDQLGLQPPKRKAELQEAVAADLSRPGRAHELLEDAPEPVRELALSLSQGPPTVNLPYTYNPRGPLPADWLKARGLVFSPSYGMAVMPREVSIDLRGGGVFAHLQLRPPTLNLQDVRGPSVSSQSVERTRQLVDDLTRLLEELAQQPAAALKNGGVGVREVRRAAAFLGRSEQETAVQLELAAAASLLGQADGQLLVTATYDAWRDQETSARWASLAAAWLQLPWRLSVAGVAAEGGKPVPPMTRHSANPHLERARRTMLAVLAALPHDSAATPASLAARLLWTVPGSVTDWREAEELLAESELLGLTVDGALSPAGRALSAGGLVRAQEALAGLLPAPSRTFVLQADLTAIATGELAPDVRAELELMAHRESTGGASVYRFSPASLRRAYDIGRDSASLLGFLTAHAERGVPQPLEYLIGDLGRRFGQLRVRSVGCYVRSDDTALLAELIRTRALTPLGLSLIAPTVVAAVADQATVLPALRENGYLPAVEGQDGQPHLQRPAAPRAPAIPRRSSPAVVDVAAFVARLRQAPPADGQLRLVPDLPDLDDLDDERPSFAASDRGTMLQLLTLALEQEWALGIVLGTQEILLELWEVVNGELWGLDLSSGNEIRVSLVEVKQLRVLGFEEEFGLQLNE